MKIKAFLQSGRFKIINVLAISDMQIIVRNYQRWEYIL